MSSYYDETADVYSESVRKARKEHWCRACQETIRIGDYYSVTAIVGDGNACAYKRCMRCQKIHLHLRSLSTPGDGFWPDERLNCGEEYKQHWGAEPPEEIAALAFKTADEIQEEVRASRGKETA